jgi:hypothetical protein
MASDHGTPVGRRSFLASLGLGTAAVVLGGVGGLPRRLRAVEPARDRLFVFAYFEGGWDVLLSLDPRDPATNDPRQSGIDLGWAKLPRRFATMGWDGPGAGRGLVEVPGAVAGAVRAFGPAIGGMRRHHALMCLVQGVNMETLTHEVGRRLFLTGRQPLGLAAQGSATPTLVTAQQGPRTLVPNLSFRVETYADSQPPYATGLKVASVEDLQRALSVGHITFPADVQARIDAARSAGGCAREQIGRRRIDDFEASRQRARAMTAAHLERHFDFLATPASNPRGLAPDELAEMEGLRSRYGITDLTGAEAQAALAFQALRHGVAQSVSVMLADGLDTHGVEWKTEQPRRLERGFDALAVLVDDLRASGLWERTTLLVWSEFSRMATLNVREGRDHSLCNSALLMGAGIRPGRLLGGSADGLRPLPVDLATGLPDEARGTSLSAKHVLSTLFASAGLDGQHLRVPPIGAALG